MNNLFVYTNIYNDPANCQIAAVFFEPSTGRMGERFEFTGPKSFVQGIFPAEVLNQLNKFITENQRPQHRNALRIWFAAGTIDHEILRTDFYAHHIVPEWNLTSCSDHFTLQDIARAGGWDGYLPAKPTESPIKYANICAGLISEAWQFLITPRVENWRSESELTTRMPGAL